MYVHRGSALRGAPLLNGGGGHEPGELRPKDVALAGRLRDLHVMALRPSRLVGLRKWHSRRAFILDLDPPRRASMAWALEERGRALV